MGVLAIPLMVLSAAGSAESQRTAGKISKIEGKLQARQSELGAIQREGDRKSRLADAMASQNASAGSRNIAAFEGSPLTILQADIAAEETATQRDVFSSELEAFTSRARGSVADRQSKAKANMGLLQAGSSFAKMAQ